MAINTNTRPRKLKRKLPLRNIVDPELVSSPTSANMLDDLVFPSHHDRVILSQLWDDKDPRSDLPHVILGITNQKKQQSIYLGTRQKSYLQRLKENSSPLSFDLSTQSIIPTSIANSMSIAKEANQYTKSKELDDEVENGDMDVTDDLSQEEHFTILCVTADTPLSQKNDFMIEKSSNQEIIDPDVQEEKVTVHNLEVMEQEDHLHNNQATTNSVMHIIKDEAVKDDMKDESPIESDDSSDDEWMNSTIDNDKQEKMYQNIFEMMSAPKPVVISHKKHQKLVSLKASKSLDWLENITAIFASRKQQKKRKVRREKLRNKLDQPYIIKKKIKSIWHIK